MPGRVVVQWDKEDCADLGIIKVDLLGLGMMAVLGGVAGADVREEVDLAQLPPTIPKVYPQLQKADTIGMFQVESRAQMSSLPRMKPERFYDIVVQVALIARGRSSARWCIRTCAGAGREKADCLHPSLEAGAASARWECRCSRSSC